LGVAVFFTGVFFFAGVAAALAGALLTLLAPGLLPPERAGLDIFAGADFLTAFLAGLLAAFLAGFFASFFGAFWGAFLGAFFNAFLAGLALFLACFLEALRVTAILVLACFKMWAIQSH
jgi:hypothetical protein